MAQRPRKDIAGQYGAALPRDGLLDALWWQDDTSRPDDVLLHLAQQAIGAGDMPGSTGATAGKSGPSAQAMPPKVSRATEINRRESHWPLLSRGRDRRESIIQDTPSIFLVRDNPKVDGSEPWYASRSYGTDAVRKYGPLVDQAAKSAGLDADLVRAIMYVEHANGGFYGYAAQHAGIAKSLYPMNIRPDLWQTLAGPNANFDDPQTNIDAGVRLIKRIRDRLATPSAARIATLYNNMAADFTSDYGAQVENAYRAKPWLLPPWIGRGPVPPGGYR